MSDQHELQSLDKLFKKAFDDLPDTPAASGWDQPNPRVWENLQGAIRPAHAGHRRWQYRAALAGVIVTAAAVAVLYLSTSTPEQEAKPALPPDQNVAVAPMHQAAEQPTSVNSPALDRNIQQTRAITPAALPEPLESERPDIVGETGLAEQLPGTIPAPPNTTEGLKAELGTIWLRPLTPLPSPQVPRRVEKRR